jgi:antitoxin (DNA-binding transcriptional repressor) of toxin-antitoxin stability system
MSSNATVTDVARHFAAYINRVALRGERFILTRGKKPVAELRPVPVGKRLGELPALLASLPRLSEDEAAAWRSELERARAEVAERPPRDPWES